MQSNSNPTSCRARKLPLPELAELETQGIIEPVEPGGVLKASPVV